MTFSLQGKFIRINFDASGYIAGANIGEFALNKHILYLITNTTHSFISVSKVLIIRLTNIYDSASIGNLQSTFLLKAHKRCGWDRRFTASSGGGNPITQVCIQLKNSEKIQRAVERERQNVSYSLKDSDVSYVILSCCSITHAGDFSAAIV